MIVKRIVDLAEFRTDAMGKSTVARGEFVYAGLNAFEPGQEHKAHAHEGQDKLYLVLEGAGEVTVGDQTELLTTGDLALAPAGVMHSVKNPGPSRLVVLAILAPPPRAK
jgi:quercetin dioxygenase-like cupin family protein